MSPKKRTRSETVAGSSSLALRGRDPFEKVACPGGVSLEVITVKDERFITLRSLVTPYGKDPASTRRVLESEGYAVPRFKAPNVDGRWRDTPCVGYFQAIAVVAALDTRGMSPAEKKKLFNFRTALPAVLQKYDAPRTQLAVAPSESPQLVLSISNMAALIKRVAGDFTTGLKRIAELVSHGNEALNERIVNVDTKLDLLMSRPVTRPQEASLPPSLPAVQLEYARPVRADGSTKLRFEEPCVTLLEVTDKIDQHLGHGLGITNPKTVRDRAYELGIWEKDAWGYFDPRMNWLLDKDSVDLLKQTFREDQIKTNSRTQPASQ